MNGRRLVQRHNMKKNVTIWCDDAIGYLSASYLVEKYKNQNREIIIVTRASLVKTAESYFPQCVIKSREVYDSKLKNKIFHLYKLFFTDPLFAKPYRDVKTDLYGRLLCKISEIIRLYKIRQLTRILLFVFFRFCRHSKFDTSLVITFSRVSCPYLFFGQTIKHLHIVESWDHAYKEPWFLRPRRTMVWNSDIRDEVKQYQGITRFHRIKPLKFLYAGATRKRSYSTHNPDFEAAIEENYSRDMGFIGKNIRKYIVYPLAFSDSNLDYVVGELRFLDHLVEAAMHVGVTVYLKPKPFGQNGLLSSKFSNHSNVFVGSEPLLNNGLDLLSPTYNHYRRSLLKNCLKVIDIGSSFVIDAAMAEADTILLKITTFGYSDKFDRRRIDLGHQRHFKDYWRETDGGIESLSAIIMQSNDKLTYKIRRWISHW